MKRQTRQDKMESMAQHLGIDDRRKQDRRKVASPWLGVERRVAQRRNNPYLYRKQVDET